MQAILLVLEEEEEAATRITASSGDVGTAIASEALEIAMPDEMATGVIDMVR